MFLMCMWFSSALHPKEKISLSPAGASQEEKRSGGSQGEGPGGAQADMEPAPTKPPSPVAETFRVIQGAVSVEHVRSTQGVFQFELSGKILARRTFPCSRC